MSSEGEVKRHAGTLALVVSLALLGLSLAHFIYQYLQLAGAYVGLAAP